MIDDLNDMRLIGAPNCLGKFVVVYQNEILVHGRKQVGTGD